MKEPVVIHDGQLTYYSNSSIEGKKVQAEIEKHNLELLESGNVEFAGNFNGTDMYRNVSNKPQSGNIIKKLLSGLNKYPKFRQGLVYSGIAGLTLLLFMGLPVMPTAYADSEDPYDPNDIYGEGISRYNAVDPESPLGKIYKDLVEKRNAIRDNNDQQQDFIFNTLQKKNGEEAKQFMLNEEQRTAGRDNLDLRIKTPSKDYEFGDNNYIKRYDFFGYIHPSSEEGVEISNILMKQKMSVLEEISDMKLKEDVYPDLLNKILNWNWDSIERVLTKDVQITAGSGNPGFRVPEELSEEDIAQNESLIKDKNEFIKSDIEQQDFIFNNLRKMSGEEAKNYMRNEEYHTNNEIFPYGGPVPSDDKLIDGNFFHKPNRFPDHSSIEINQATEGVETGGETEMETGDEPEVENGHDNGNGNGDGNGNDNGNGNGDGNGNGNGNGKCDFGPSKCL